MASIVLVHGLWNRGWSMAAMAKRLRFRGHHVLVFSYPTRAESLEGHADALYKFLDTNRTDEMHLVGHSMGGLVILNMLDRHNNLPPGRVVLIGTPIKGSAVVKRLEKLPGQNFLFGKVKGDLLRGYQHTPAGHETGVISGTRAFGFGQLAGRHKEPNDGTVAVSETLLDGLKDHIELNVAHTEMLVSAEVVEQVEQFVLHGGFKKPEQ